MPNFERTHKLMAHIDEDELEHATKAICTLK